MLNLLREFWADEQGFLISMELVLIATIGVLGLIVGLSCLSTAIVTEFQDIGGSIRSMNQSYYFGGFRGCKSWVPGSSYFNRGVYTNTVTTDICDIGLNTSTYTTVAPTVTSPTVTTPTVVCPPGTVGPAITDPAYSSPGTTVIPCPSQDCAKSQSAPVGPIAPTPDTGAQPIPRIENSNILPMPPSLSPSVNPGQ